MAIWRLFGIVPHSNTVEQNRAIAFDGWRPTAGLTSLNPVASTIVVPDVTNVSRKMRANVYGMNGYAKSQLVAVAYLDDHSRCYFVHASVDEPGAFEALNVRYEGHWRFDFDPAAPSKEFGNINPRLNKSDDPFEKYRRSLDHLPWPAPDEAWDRRDFLPKLRSVEGRARVIKYRGFSHCRLCGQRNGSNGLQFEEWEWPEGFRHYIEDHRVRPSPDFEAFILANAGTSERGAR